MRVQFPAGTVEYSRNIPGACGSAHEHSGDAIVVLAFDAEFAVAAGDAGLDDDAVAGREIVNARANRNDFTGRLMAEDLRINGGRFADAAILIPVQIAATNAGRADADSEFAVTGDRAAGGSRALRACGAPEAGWIAWVEV